MADQKISELSELVDIARDDYFPIVNTSGNITEKISSETLKKYISGGVNSDYFPNYNEADQGNLGDGESVKACIDEIGSDNATLIFQHNSGEATTSYTFSTNETIPSNVRVIIEKGVLLSIDTGKIITIDGYFGCGLYQGITGAGTIVFGAGSINKVYPEWWGARADSSTDSGAAINLAINSISNIYGEVVGTSGVYIIETTVNLKSGIVFIGNGSVATRLKLKDSADIDIVRSEGFDSLTGQNKWYVADGVPHGFGLKHVLIDGNKANQSSSNSIGINFYGKRYIVEDVIVTDTFGKGFYSEGAAICGQVDWRDSPEASISGLNIRNCGSLATDHGFHFRGPHDTIIKSLIVHKCAGNGVLMERLADNYNGICDIGTIHSYSNSKVGFEANCQFRAKEIITENSEEEGFKLSGYKSQINILQAYDNCKTTGSFQGILEDAAYTTINNLQITDNGNNIGGLDSNSLNVVINGVYFEGNGSTGTALRVNNNNNKFQGTIKGFSGVGGVGLYTAQADAIYGCSFDLSIIDCTTHWNNGSAAGERNCYFLNILGEAGQIGWSGSGPNVYAKSETWDVYENINEAKKYSARRIYHATGVNLNSVTAQEFNISHGLLTNPEIANIQVSLSYAGANDTWEIQQMYVKNIDTVNKEIDIVVKLSIAAGVAAVGNLIVNVSL